MEAGFIVVHQAPYAIARATLEAVRTGARFLA